MSRAPRSAMDASSSAHVLAVAVALDRIGARARAPGKEDERQREGRDPGGNEVRRAVPVDVGYPTERRLGNHTARGRHERVERQDGRPLAGWDEPVDERLAK